MPALRQNRILRRSFAAAVLLTGLCMAEGAKAGAPKLVVIVQEKVMGVLGTTGFEQPNKAELTLMQHFGQLGFAPLDPTTVKRNITQAKGLRLLEGDDVAAAAVGLQHGAPYSLVGLAISKPAGSKLYGTQIQTLQATVTARLIRNNDARVLATASANAVQPHVDEVVGGVMAIEKAARQVATDLGQQMAALDLPGAGSETAGTDIALNISGLVSFRHLEYVMRFLEKDVEGVGAVGLESYSSGIAAIAVDYQGEMRNLALRFATQKFKGFRLEPTHVGANRMDIKAVLNTQ